MLAERSRASYNQWLFSSSNAQDGGSNPGYLYFIANYINYFLQCNAHARIRATLCGNFLNFRVESNLDISGFGNAQSRRSRRVVCGIMSVYACTC